MSLQISNTTTKRGLVQLYEKELGLDYGTISNDSEKLAEFIARVCLALDNYLLIWAKNAGTWEADDINHLDYQIITTSIVSGRRDYPFTTDENSNRVVDVSKVLILPSSTATEYIEINPVDELITKDSNILLDTRTGRPTQYGKMANAVFLDLIPNYSATNGLKMVVNREGSYPTTSNTTKVIGVPVYHEYFYLKPAYEHATIYGTRNLAELEKKVIDLEGSERLRVTGKIADFFGYRQRDVKPNMKANVENTH